MKITVHLPRRAPALFAAFLLLLTADSLQGANPLSSTCVVDPPPLSAGGAVWFPQDPQFALRAGRELIARKDSRAALCYFQLIDPSQEMDADFWIDFGDAYWDSEQPERALGAWERAQQMGLASDELLRRMRNGYLATRQWEKAAAESELWLVRHDTDVEAKYELALIQAALDPGGSLELLAAVQQSPAPISGKAKALEDVIRAAIVFRDPAYLYARTGEELIRLGEPALAMEALRRAIDRNPDYGEAHALMGLAQEATGEDPGDSYRQGVKYSPKSAMACLLFGSWLRRKGEIDLAGFWLSQAWELKTGDWTVAAELATIDFASGNIPAAEDRLLQAIESNPAEPDAWMALAAFYIENDIRVQESGIPAARQAVLLAPKDDRALDLLGLGWYKLGDFAEAERFFRSALEQNPESAEAHLHLGMCLLEEGQTAQAGAELERAILLDPKGTAGAQAKEYLGRIL